MNIVLCEDNMTDLDNLSNLVEQYATAHSLMVQSTSYHSAEELLSHGCPVNCSCVFLDIYMDKLSGIEAAKQLRALGYSGSLVFTTSSREHVFESFLVDVTDYLVKPFDYQRFCFTMDKITKTQRRKFEFITLMCNGVSTDILTKDITYIETGDHYSVIHTVSGILRTSTPINKLEKLLENNSDFLKCHRSYLVNMNYIASMDETMLTMQNRDRVLMAVRGLSATKKKISHFMWNKAEVKHYV